MNAVNQDRKAGVLPRAEPPSKGSDHHEGVHGLRKIFFLVDSLNLGGTETQAVDLARRLDPARYDVTLGCLRAQGPLLERLRDSSVAIVEFHPKGGLDSAGGIYQLLRLSAFLRRCGFDIVHTHDLWSNLMGVPAAWMARVPVIISSRHDLSNFEWYKSGRRVWLRRIQNLSDVVLTNADPIRDGLIAEDGFAPQKVRVIHNGVDVERFSVAPRDRSKLFPGAGEGELIVLVGNMHSDVKGHPWLIAAAPAIVREFPQTRFVFAGDGEQRKEFERQVEELGLRRKFLFLGRRDEIPGILACCHVAVLPSKAEGLPNAVLEYLAAGLPTIASKVGGNAEIIEDGVTGLLVPPQDSEALAAAVLRLLRNPDLARRLAEGGHEYVRQNFSLERLIEQVDNLYTELLQPRKGPKPVRNRAGKNRWRRLVSMSPEELADRLRQRLTARSDLLRCKLGVAFDPGLRVAAIEQKPRFFFSPEAVPSLCASLKQRLPENVEATLQRAERICRHRFDLVGYEDLDYGAEIDWHCDRVHNQRAPRKPWFKIHYLDFAEVGDSKITWELNRHQHLVTLAKAYRFTGNGKFVAELFRQWRYWHEENPYPIGMNWASSLEVAIRSLSWLWVYFLLAGSMTMRDFRTEWLRALRVNGRHIETYLSTYFSPNTHLLGEGVALFFIGTLCPELKSAKRWKRRGWEIVLREAERQVQADGLHFEQSTYYHVYALDFLLHAGVLASINDVPIPSQFDRTLERMLDALCTLGRAGPPPRSGDDDGGRVFDPSRNRAEHLVDPLATGAVLFARGDFKRVAGGLREETLWLLGEQGVAEFDRLPAKDPAQGSVALRAGGLYVMANTEPRQQLALDAGPQGAFAAGHGHADALSMCVNSRGRELLIDPGTFEYVGAERDVFRGTRAHNTLLVDGVDQTEPKGPFGWTKLPNVKAEGWINGHSFDLFVGSHDGYCRLEPPVVHRRWVFSLKGQFWLVRDMALGSGEHQLDLFWHLNPELSARSRGVDTFIDAGGREGLRILAAEGHDWSQDVRQEQWSPVYGRKEPAQVLHFGTTTKLPAEFVTLLEPVVDANISHGSLSRMRQSSKRGLVSGYRYGAPEVEHYIFFGQSNAWTLGPWSSDAEFLYWGRSADRARQVLICCNGTYVEAHGQKFVSCPRQVLRCEICAGEQVDVFSSDKDAIVNEAALQNVCAELEPVLTSGLPGCGKTGL